MPANFTEVPNLELSALPQFHRNKPRDSELYGRAPSIPISDRGSSHMLLLSAPWHDQYVRQVERRIVEPVWDGEDPLTDEQVMGMRELIEQIKCVAALTRLVEQGTSNPLMLIDRQVNPAIPLGEFMQQNPYLYVTARQADQEGKDPRYVAKLEEVVELGYDHESRGLSMDLIVSDAEGNKGHFPADTKAWSLAHLATTHMVHLPDVFRYINNGYR